MDHEVIGVFPRWELYEAPNFKDSSTGQVRPVGWLPDNDSDQGSKDGWLGSPPRISIVSKQQDRLDLLDMGEQPRRLN